MGARAAAARDGSGATQSEGMAAAIGTAQDIRRRIPRTCGNAVAEPRRVRTRTRSSSVSAPQLRTSSFTRDSTTIPKNQQS